MASQRFNLQDFLVGLTKFIFGVAIALLVISLAGAATARYFLTQLSTLPERPVYDNDAPVATSAPAEQQASAPPAEQPAPAEPQTESAEPKPESLYKVIVTYGAGLLVRTGPGADAATIDGVDYDETVEVLEESGRWYKVRTNSGIEGWIKGQGNTRRL
jgi:uncharacterized protein YgiM (DUF1202 family)